MVVIGEVYRHFKGNYYVVLAVATHTETQEELVIYKNRSNGKVYARPYNMFISPVDKTKYPNCTQECRFQLISISQ